MPLTELAIKTSCYDFCSPRKPRNIAFNMRSTVHSFSVLLKKYYRADLLASSTELVPRPRVEGWGWGSEDREGGGGGSSALNCPLPVSNVLSLQRQIYQSFPLTLL